MSSDVIARCRAQPPPQIHGIGPTFSLLAITRFINFRQSGCLDRDFAGRVCGTLISIAENGTLHTYMLLPFEAHHTLSVPDKRAVRGKV